MISPLLDIEFPYKTLKELEDLCGKIPIIHVEDACEAHIFCIENDSIKGRFLCASDYVSAAEIAECLQQTHPELHVKQMYMEGPKRTVKWGSTKLIDQGFEYKHDMKMILDDCVKSWRRLDGSLYIVSLMRGSKPCLPKSDLGFMKITKVIKVWIKA